jgi:hypothetical protein
MKFVINLLFSKIFFYKSFEYLQNILILLIRSLNKLQDLAFICFIWTKIKIKKYAKVGISKLFHN